MIGSSGLRRVSLSAAIASQLLGCTCGPEARVDAAIPIASPVETAPPPSSLPFATRTDLPPAVPRIRATVSLSNVVVSNRELVLAWPRDEQERLASHRPPEAESTYPIIERVLSQGDAAGLRQAFHDVMQVEQDRNGGHGAPSLFSVHAAPQLRFEFVRDVLTASSLEGLTSPRFVLMQGPQQVELFLVSEPPTHGSEQPIESVEALRRALEEQRNIHGDEQRVHLELRPGGLFARRGDVMLGPACGPHPSSMPIETPAFGLRELTPNTLRLCLERAGLGRPQGDRAVTFSASPDVSYIDVIRVLEPLAPLVSVDLAF